MSFHFTSSSSSSSSSSIIIIKPFMFHYHYHYRNDNHHIIEQDVVEHKFLDLIMLNITRKTLYTFNISYYYIITLK